MICAYIWKLHVQFMLFINSHECPPSVQPTAGCCVIRIRSLGGLIQLSNQSNTCTAFLGNYTLCEDNPCTSLLLSVLDSLTTRQLAKTNIVPRKREMTGRLDTRFVCHFCRRAYSRQSVAAPCAVVRAGPEMLRNSQRCNEETHCPMPVPRWCTHSTGHRR